MVNLTIEELFCLSTMITLLSSSLLFCIVGFSLKSSVIIIIGLALLVIFLLWEELVVKKHNLLGD